jgi:hypothetical protein
MQSYSLIHVEDAVLLRDLVSLAAQDRLTTAMLLAHIAEVDARKLFAPAGYPSMHAYCVEELRLSEDAAYKRIQAARAARQHPVIFDALAEGKLHLAAVCLLAPHLRSNDAGELIRAASGKKKAEVEVILARRFGTSLEVSRVSAVPAIASSAKLQLAPGQVDEPALSDSEERDEATVASSVLEDDQLAPGQVEERYFLQVTIAKDTYDKLRYAQALLSHALPNGEIAPVLDRALDLLITKLERRKFGAVRGSGHEARLAARDAHSLARREAVRREAKVCVADRARRHALAQEERVRDVLAGLRNLGYRPYDARRAADYCEELHCATLEESLRAAIGYLSGRSATSGDRDLLRDRGSGDYAFGSVTPF